MTRSEFLESRAAHWLSVVVVRRGAASTGVVVTRHESPHQHPGGRTRTLIPVSIPRACRKASLRLKAVTTHVTGRDIPGIASATE
jgi:hypothetical protein